MSFFTTRYTKQPKFNPIVRNDLKDNDSIEVRLEGYDLTSVSMSREQYMMLRDAIGKFKPGAAPAPPPPPVQAADDWAS